MSRRQPSPCGMCLSLPGSASARCSLPGPLVGNWGGFLAANHKAWMAMWDRGIPPDADVGRVDLVELLPYLSWQGRGAAGSGGLPSKGGEAASKQ